MRLFTKDHQDCLKEVFVHFVAEEVNREYETSLTNLQKKVEFPGYRTGKVPFEIIEKNSADELNRTVMNGLIYKSIDRLESEGVIIYSEPRFKPFSNLVKNAPFSFSIVFESAPVVMGSIDIENASIEYDEYYYDTKMLEYSIKEEFKSLSPINGKIEEKDTVTVKLLNAKNVENSETLFDSSVIKSLIGHKKGDVLKLALSEMDSYVLDFMDKTESDEIEVEIVNIERPTIQDLTDELVQQVSPSKTVSDYKEKAEERFKAMQKQLNEINKKNALLSYIGKEAKVNVPKSEFIRLSQREIFHFIESNFFLSELALNNILEDKKIREEFTALPDRINEKLIYYTAVKDIAKKNSLQPNNEVINRIAKSYAKEHNMTLEEYKQNSSKEEWNSVLEMAEFEAGVQFLMEKAHFKTRNKVPLVQTK
jgi:trigger factor